MAALTVQTISEGGLVLPTYETAASGGDTMANTGKEFLLVKNGHGSATRTVTVTAQTTSLAHPTLGTLSRDNIAVTIVAGKTVLIGPFYTEAFNTDAGNIAITYSDSAANITILAIKFNAAS
tara:strand:- start:1304 stop:1669 length:366 start_codon:yes stop_codon:yes gene_type:complete